MVLALFILLYYFYVVCDFVSQVYFYRDDGVSYEENAIASHEAGQHNNAEFQTDEGLPDIRPAPSIEERKSLNKKSSIISVGSTAKLSIASSTSKLKSANKGRKSVHVILHVYVVGMFLKLILNNLQSTIHIHVNMSSFYICIF